MKTRNLSVSTLIVSGSMIMFSMISLLQFLALATLPTVHEEKDLVHYLLVIGSVQMR